MKKTALETQHSPLLTCRYYLEETNGDIKAAVRMARLDDSWDHQEGYRRGHRFVYHV